MRPVAPAPGTAPQPGPARRRPLPGFTLVELLVVIVIIAMLIALLMPAVNAAREAGRRTTCVNNQFQIAFASMRFNDSSRALPGWRNALPRTSDSGTNFPTWTVMLLPNLERNDIHRTWQTASPSAPYVSFFVCPSTPPDALTQPTLAYVASAGVGSNAQGLRHTGVFVDRTGTGSMAASVSLDDVAAGDGTATTLLLSEECGPRVPTPTQLTWNFQPAVANGVVSWTTNTPVFGILSANGPAKIINSGTFVTGSSSAANMPSSQHPGGAVVAFCDGHTGFLKDSLQRQVYGQLMSWNHAQASGTAPYSNWVPATYVLQEGDYQ